MPSQSQCVEIPVLPHVKSLLISIYGNEPIKASENNLPGKELRFIFMSAKNPVKGKIYGEKIAIRVSHRLAPYYYKFSNAFSLGCYFEKQFNVLLFAHIEAQRNCGVQITQAVKSFFKKYNIDEESYTQQAALEGYRRIKSHAHLDES